MREVYPFHGSCQAQYIDKLTTAMKAADFFQHLGDGSGIDAEDARRLYKALVSIATEEVQNRGEFHIPGIGRLARTGGSKSTTRRGTTLRTFLCHSSEDKAVVRNLYRRLSRVTGIFPWLDERDLLAGQDWEHEISKAVRACDVVIVCLSQQSIAKTGFVQREISQALDVSDEKPKGTIFIIPLRLEPCV